MSSTEPARPADDMPAALPSMWRALRRGFDAEPALLTVAFALIAARRPVGEAQTRRGEAQVEVNETLIRRMTRLAIEHGAVNLSQGFTDEAPVYDLVWSGIRGDAGAAPRGAGRRENRVDDAARVAGRARRDRRRGARISP